MTMSSINHDSKPPLQLSPRAQLPSTQPRPPQLPHSTTAPTTTTDLYNFNIDNQPIASSSTSHHHHRETSSSTHTSSTPSSNGYTNEIEDDYYPPPSTAPTTPDLTTLPNPPRTWRPTPRVPSHIARRHRATQPRDRSVDSSMPDRGDGARNRWLSEDEGVGEGIVGSITRRRRRASRDEFNSIGPSSHNVSTSTVPPPTQPGSSSQSGVIPKPRLKSRSPRPIVRRAMSQEVSVSRVHSPQSADRVDITNLTSGVGGEPPRIHDIVPAPSVTAVRVATMGDRRHSGGSGWDRREHDTLEDEQSVVGSRPGSRQSIHQELRKTRDKQRELLQKLRKILGW
jgi:hypothetical protein